MDVGAVGEAAAAHGTHDRASVCFVLADANGIRTRRAAHGDIQFDALLVVDLGREHDVGTAARVGDIGFVTQPVRLACS